jgi:transposase
MATLTSQPLTPAGLDLQQLPDDALTLKGLIVELVQALDEQQQHAAHLQGRLDQLLRRLYGRRSERLDPSQLSIHFGQDDSTTTTIPPTDMGRDAEATAGLRRRRRTGHGRQRLPEHLRRQDIRHELSEAQRGCPCCGQLRVALSEEVTEQLEFVPASFVVLRHVRVTYVCHRCEHDRQHPEAEVANLPDAEVTPVRSRTKQLAASSIAGPTGPEASAEPFPLPLGDKPPMDTTSVNAVAAPIPQVEQVASVGPDLPNTRPPLAGDVAAVATSTLVVPPSEVAATPGATGTDTGTAGRSVSPVVSDAGVPPRSSTFVTAPMPAQPIAKCLAGPGLLAHIIVSKFADHLPLYRQEQIFLREGVWLSRRTLCDWLAGCAGVLRPLYDLMWQRVFGSAVLHTDDTPVRVQQLQTKGHLWVYLGNSTNPYTVYDFTLGRCADRPVECLSGYKGFLHADAYNGYDQVFREGCVEVGCWAHARRYFHEARTTDPVRACYMLAVIGQLYALEAAAKYAAVAAKLTESEFWDVRRQLRERQALPLLGTVWEYAAQVRSQLLPRSPIGEAFTYLHNQQRALERYTSHGCLNIDNNVAEQALRAVALGRKNWLFFGSEEGGKTAAVLYSFTQTCKRHGLDPWFYLREVLTILPTLSAADRVTELPKLLPDQWAAAQSSSSAGGSRVV